LPHEPQEALVHIILLTSAAQPTTEVLPALGLLTHRVTVLPTEASALLNAPVADVVVLDARRDLTQARSFSRILRAAETEMPVLAVLSEGGLVALSAEWQVDDVVLDTAGPAELDARLRLAIARSAAQAQSEVDPDIIKVGDLVIDETTYTAKLRSVALDLTYKEFELLKYLAQQPGRVFTRARLLQDVWGYDYFGGTRTVDVHVRRLRAKLGVEHEGLIGTVRNVGYKFVRPVGGRDEVRAAAPVKRGKAATTVVG
jgi:DNA-binding response OmpR family regulator